jgi:Flp pilus assembly protein TadG
MCLPILFLLVVGCFEICHASMLQHAAESAAYEGARAGVIPGATQERCQDSAAFVLRSMGIRGFTVRTNPESITTSAPTINVEVSVPLRSNTIFAPFLFSDPIFRGNCELVREIL